MNGKEWSPGSNRRWRTGRRDFDTTANETACVSGTTIFGALMITHTLTSDPAVGLELTRRIAVASRRQPRPSRLQAIWTRWFTRQPVKMVPVHT